MFCETVPVQINYGELKDFPAYCNKLDTKEIIYDSNLKGKKIPENSTFQPLASTDIDTVLLTGTYKLVLEVQNEQNSKHFTDISKGILIDNEIKDVYFHKIDVVSTNGNTIVTTIFEILENPIPIFFIIYALGSIGVSIAIAYSIKSITKVVPVVSINIVKIGISIIVTLLGIKVISKW